MTLFYSHLLLPPVLTPYALVFESPVVSPCELCRPVWVNMTRAQVVVRLAETEDRSSGLSPSRCSVCGRLMDYADERISQYRAIKRFFCERVQAYPIQDSVALLAIFSLAISTSVERDSNPNVLGS
ncbi:hypothetical protein K443DRAFT_674914 [Laccaria amethystina LaAM-08-1]|uniref:Uncharacterized protein n=1 Tax=Laccaria amethystina LaAM-08-1 TaxID=1095629 RepID=A0A0C9YBX7_9AGAR|nr:hypothetical protein K443DRAFT_674914 [Laccaria amethystina LaAM-08-1]